MKDQLPSLTPPRVVHPRDEKPRGLGDLLTDIVVDERLARGPVWDPEIKLFELFLALSELRRESEAMSSSQSKMLLYLELLEFELALAALNLLLALEELRLAR